jgi:uncharacterized membrane protein YraQ (UPF0718 family)/copper chaperone CopZ
MIVLNALTGILRETYQLWLEMGIYLVFGFTVAGVLSRFLKGETVIRHLGHDTWGAVVKAALFGVPLPLCSCGVIPVGLSLYKRGASRGAATAFLITTPQTGVDSILVTYAMLGPLGLVFAIVRPISAFLNGLLGGALVTWFDHRDGAAAARKDAASQTFTSDTRCASGDCSIPAAPPSAQPRQSFASHAAAAFLYGFWDFPREIVKWLVIGIVAAGAISSLMPADPQFLQHYLGGGFSQMLVMLTVGVFLYVCATASVPFVAVLLAHGLTPGAALVFLMTGPATNIASLVLLTKMLGKRTVVLYFVSILITSFAFGEMLNLYFAAPGSLPPFETTHVHGMGFGFWHIFGGVALLLTTVAAFARNAAEALEAGKARAAMLARIAPYVVRASARPVRKAAAVDASTAANTQEGEPIAMGQTLQIHVQGMTCQNCARHVRQAAESVPGVESAFVDLKKNLLSVVGAAPDLTAIRAAVEKAGYAPGEAV